MNTKTTKPAVVSGFSLAIAAAALFAGAPAAQAGNPAASGSAQMGHCMGANACKGQSACKTATNACKGLNECKGQGFVELGSKAACESAGGHVG